MMNSVKLQIEDLYPLSPVQHGMLFHNLLAPEVGLYFVQKSCTLSGELNVEALEKAWQKMLDRHPILRTAFIWEGLDDPVQVVYRGARLLIVMSAGVPTLEQLGHAITQHNVTSLWLTSGLFNVMVDERLEDLSRVRQLLAGGDVLSVPHVRRAAKALRGGHVINGYGPTEGTTFTCCHHVRDERELHDSVPIGRPIANTQVYLLDEQLCPAPTGAPGALFLGGDGLARGYLNRPDLTAERFIPHPFSEEGGARLYRTGDRASFTQEHVPGRQAQSDFTHLSELLVTIAGQVFKHLFYHFTLVYSNWEWGMVCASESWESLCEGLQNALWQLGGVPAEHRTDSLTAAVKPVGSRDEFTERYQGLLRHYGMKGSHTTPARGHENGDVEQWRHRFKRAVEQELLLRGSRDFASREEYEEFLRKMLMRRNGLRRERIEEEMRALRRLPDRRLESFSKESLKVSGNSVINIRDNYYSVPSQLIGERVDVRIYAGHVEVWYAGEVIQRMERLRGEGKAMINYRHLIHSLVRKPGAFAHYRFRASLFPRVIFRLAYDELQSREPGQADRVYLQLLKLAAEESEERVAAALYQLLNEGEAVSAARVGEIVLAASNQAWGAAPSVMIEPTPLESYDRLLYAEEVA